MAIPKVGKHYSHLHCELNDSIRDHMMKHATVVLLFAIVTVQAQKNFNLVAEWKDLEYVFPSPLHRQQAIQSGRYIRRSSIPIDVDVEYRDQGQPRIFVTIPRFVPGVPITFGFITFTGLTEGPIIQPYPSYDMHSSHGEDCDCITSVFRVTIDECRRLWVLDSGRIGLQQLCPPQLLVYSLDNDDQLIRRYRFPVGQYRPGTSLFITPVVDVRDPPPSGRCASTRVYIADATGFGILVYDWQQNLSWRVQNRLVYPHPPHGMLTIAGESFVLMDGIFGMALSPRDPNRNDRVLFFHALASVTENSVNVSVLNNQTAWEENVNSLPTAFHEIGSRPSHSMAEAMDKNGNLFFGLTDPIAIACWDSEKPYTQSNIQIVASNATMLQFSSGVKVIQNRNGSEDLWIVTNRLQKSRAGTMDHNEVNFRIQSLSTTELLDGRSKCPGRSFVPYYEN